MSYIKLSKAQDKQLERIQAWMKNEPFKENAKAKPAIPELTIEDVLEQYIPDSPSGTGGYLTPLEMVNHLTSYAAISPGWKILDPCAGIGGLLYPFRHDDVEIHAWELALGSFEVGRKLFPDFHWRQANAYDGLHEFEGYFDAVFMNPPFNIVWATSETKLVSKATKSEHMMLEVALRALKPDGTLYAIAPDNWIDRIPKAAQQWFHPRMSVTDLGQLPGEFLLTKINVHGWQINRVAHPDDIVVEKVLEVQPMTTGTSQSALPEEKDIDPIRNPHAVTLPDEVFTGIRASAKAFDDHTSIKATSNWLKQNGYRTAARWVTDHHREFGAGYWNGFYNATTGEMLQLS